MRSIKNIVVMSGLLISGIAYAQTKSEAEQFSYESKCKNLFNVCESGKCSEENNVQIKEAINYCVANLPDDGPLTKLLSEIFEFNKEIKSKPAEQVKAKLPEMKNKISTFEKEIVHFNENVEKLTKMNDELNIAIFNTTRLFTKEYLISNNKSFYTYLDRENNLVDYQKFYKEVLFKGGEEIDVDDLHNQTLPKKQCLLLTFHHLQNYSDNEGIQAIADVGYKLNGHKIKCQ